MGRTLVIAELGSSWRFGNDERPFENAKRMIREAASCGADIVKMQWTSDAAAMPKRRGLNGDAANMYAKYLQWPKDWMQHFRAEADACGVEWACTVYLPQDIPVIAPLVKRFKVSAFEGAWCEFVRAHHGYGKPVIRSFSAETDKHAVPDSEGLKWIWRYGEWEEFKSLWCVSEYPTPLEHLKLGSMRGYLMSGLSDHTVSTLTGAVAVGSFAQIIEKHVRLWDTPQDNPDYGHSLILDSDGEEMSFAEYVRLIREAERCM